MLKFKFKQEKQRKDLQQKKQSEGMKKTERTVEAITNSLEALHSKIKEKKTLRLELVQDNGYQNGR